MQGQAFHSFIMSADAWRDSNPGLSSRSLVVEDQELFLLDPLTLAINQPADPLSVKPVISGSVGNELTWMLFSAVEILSHTPEPDA